MHNLLLFEVFCIMSGRTPGLNVRRCPWVKETEGGRDKQRKRICHVVPGWYVLAHETETTTGILI